MKSNKKKSDLKSTGNKNTEYNILIVKISDKFFNTIYILFK